MTPISTSRARGSTPRAGGLRAGRLAALLALAPLLPAQEGAPGLEVTATGRTDGHATLTWTPAGDEADGLEFELQGARTPDFSSPERCYLGPDRASFRSGLPAGLHHFRVRQRPAGEAAGETGPWSPWSAAATVEIRPYPLRTAWTLFAVGALLVASILGFLVVANLRLRRERLQGQGVHA